MGSNPNLGVNFTVISPTISPSLFTEEQSTIFAFVDVLYAEGLSEAGIIKYLSHLNILSPVLRITEMEYKKRNDFPANVQY
ncbi:hypothetical protein [Methanomethylovorans hollandica]|uniref:hypothetical protein n=1 Tax=Methanomethylovorans hollandica TaxID=101192 RepID=UPI0012EAF5BC|nr:hypothetical protein [Methanomethylovorans hollandica]